MNEKEVVLEPQDEEEVIEILSTMEAPEGIISWEEVKEKHRIIGGTPNDK